MSAPHRSTEVTHPLQQVVNRIINVLGILSAALVSALAIICLLMVIASALDINRFLGIGTAIVAVLSWVVLTYLPRMNIKIVSGNETHSLDAFTPLYLLIVISGFIQTGFWVVNPSNINYEPRSVFILAVAGLIAFMRFQYRKAPASEETKSRSG